MNKRLGIFILLVLLLGCSGCTNLPIFRAISSNNLEKINEMIDQGLNLNALVLGQTTPLMTAANIGNLDAVMLLVSRGADVNTKDPVGANALMYAVSNYSSSSKYSEIIDFLIDQGTDVNAKDSRGTTALMVAASNLDKESIRHLIKRGADVNVINNDGIPAWIFAIFRSINNKTSAYAPFEIINLLHTPKNMIPKDIVYLAIPQIKIEIHEERQGKPINLKSQNETTREVVSRVHFDFDNTSGNMRLGWIVKIVPGDYIYKAYYEQKDYSTNKIIKGDEIQVTLQAVGGHIYALAYELLEEPGIWLGWMEDLLAVDLTLSTK